MRKLIAAINLTLDGFCDHTAIEPDEEIHQHYTDLLGKADLALLWTDDLSTHAILANAANKSLW